MCLKWLKSLFSKKEGEENKEAVSDQPMADTAPESGKEEEQQQNQ